MATAIQRVSTLDVLWAFYQSQPKQVKTAFRNRLATQDAEQEREKSATFQWQTDLKDIRQLKDGWDGENTPRINKTAIANVARLANTLNAATAKLVRLYPTYMGAVMLKMETNNGRIKCEIGDTQMSYFVKRPTKETEHHSFEDINDGNLSTLRLNLESIV
ncbi:MAG: hypothetical protein J6T96_06325 [Bacteroidales bacterium]|nr:hypothetical protein [Bacteroidales bacterium]MBP5502882.1 hypothetical protein [Bacteroidales bacterium]